MRKFFNTRLNSSFPELFSPYHAACIKACETVQGALELAGELSAKVEGLPPNAFGAKRVLRKQLEVANHAAHYRAVEHELWTRIPAASQRDEAASKAAMKDAEREIQAAEKQVAAAKARVENFAASAEKKRSACDESSAAANNKLQLAEAALQDARDSEDAAAMSRTAEVVVQARKEVISVHDRNSALLLEANSFAELADKARAELRAADDILKAAQRNRHDAHVSLLAVLADRQTLESLLAHARWRTANEQTEGHVIPSYIDAIGFFFHQSERAPQWGGRPGSVAIGARQLNQHQGLLRALREPNWSEFDTDPSGIALDASATSADQ